VMDRVVAPIIYRILFGDAPSTDHVRGLVADVMSSEAVVATPPLPVSARKSG
jgi:hypothetical protein